MPTFVLLGSAQDGGLPHAGCGCKHCTRARADGAYRRLPASAGIASGNQRLMIDATSAFAEQEQLLWFETSSASAGERHSAPETILITHAHTGHYIGLWQLDRSVMSANGVRVVGPPKTIALLGANEPWITMQREGFIQLEPLAFDQPHDLLPDVCVILLPVPHRSEWDADTAAVRVEGPQSSVLYLPDIDQWDEWDTDLEQAVHSVDAAYLDGTFWARPPRPGIPHPPVQETMERLQTVANDGRTRIAFTHLNHSNPLVDADSPESQQVRERGFSIGHEGETAHL